MACLTTSRIKRNELMPYFSLMNPSGKKIHSIDWLRKSNLVIFFFSKLNDGLSRGYLIKLQKINARLKELEALVLGISQQDPQTIKVFSQEHSVDFNILIDKERNIADKFIECLGVCENINALFIFDRFHSLYKAYFPDPRGALPEMDEILSSIEFLERQCPECQEDIWPRDEE